MSNPSSSSIRGTLPEDDEQARSAILQHLKSQGIFDSMRRECLSEIDQKREFINLTQKIEGYVGRFLAHQEWSATLNKNQLRERLRRNLNESEMMKYGVEHLVDSAVNSKEKSFYPQIQKVVREFLGVDEDGETKKTIKEEEKDDIAQQDMEVEDEDSMSKITSVEAKVESFVSSFREVISQQHPSFDTQTSSQAEEVNTDVIENFMSEDNSVPSDMDTDDSNEVPQTSIILETIPKLETVLEELETPKKEIPPPPQEPPPAPPPPPPVEVPPPIPSAEMIEEPTKKVAPRQPPPLRPMPGMASAKSSQPQIVEAPADSLEEILSDISSVHTSDLSDFDDKISISSEEEGQVESKRKISLEEVKKLADKKEDKPKESKKKKVRQTKQNSAAIKVESSKQEIQTSRSGRERKANPKYSSDDFASMYKKSDLLPSDEEINSEEDFDQTSLKGSPEVTRSPAQAVSPSPPSPPLPLPHTPSPSVSLPKKKAESKLSDKKEIKKEATVKLEPDNITSSEESTHEPGSVLKQLKKKVQRRQERYDASDLYKPRPVIGASSRRQRSHAASDA